MLDLVFMEEYQSFFPPRGDEFRGRYHGSMTHVFLEVGVQCSQPKAVVGISPLRIQMALSELQLLN